MKLPIEEKKERASFVRWLKRQYPDVSAGRYGAPAKDQYIVCAVQEAWIGWFAKAKHAQRR